MLVRKCKVRSSESDITKLQKFIKTIKTKNIASFFFIPL